MNNRQFLYRLLATTMMGSAFTLASPANAQDASNQPGTQTPNAQKSTTAGPDANTPAPTVAVTNANESNNEAIVVTGTLFRRTNTETASPVTTLSAESLTRRGITNPSDAIRSLSSDNAGSIPNSFTNGFANGASGVSLRGLTVNSTLVVFDGLRGAYYPLPDDGQRTFVDLNTIPNVVVDRIEVLRDGASSTYGADAIGGVVNVITKRSFEGIQFSAEAGISERGDAAEHRFTGLVGTGNLGERGWNIYVGGEYYHSDPVLNRYRDFPFNTGDLSRLTCGIAPNTGPCANANPGVTSAGATVSAVVRPGTSGDPNNPFSLLNAGAGTFRILNPAGCTPGTLQHTLASGSQFCEQDLVNQYGQIQPEQERWGVTGRATFRLGGDFEAYLMGTYYQSRVTSTGAPVSIRQSSPINTNTTLLPVYVCASGTNCATAADRRLNPNNPYAAQGQFAQIFYRFGDIPQLTQTINHTYRGAAGIHGTIADGWNFSADITGMHSNLDRLYRGYPNVAALAQAINTGSYNFVNPSLNSDAVRQQIAPDVRTPATSDLYMGQAAVTHALAQLPGGPLQLGVGVSARYEALDDPTQNAGPPFVTLRINNYHGTGHRYVEAGYFEIDAPIVRQFNVNVSGRYDHYSDGFNRFSPKAGFKFVPIRQLALRGTYSRGFRAPQFFETSGTVVGFATATPANTVAAVCTQHGGTFTAGSGCRGGSAYTLPYGLGRNSAGNPNLRPEKSESYTGGVVFQPVPWFSATVDYYHIKKTDVITGGPLANQAIAAYYAGTALPPGYTVALNGADPDFPNGIRTIAVVNSPYVNSASLVTDGIDFTATVQARLTPDIKLSSSIEVTDILRFNLSPGGGAPVQHYAGTQGPYELSSGAGTPKWRANWSTSLDFGPATLTGTAYYTGAYNSTAEDETDNSAKDCSAALYDPAFCRTKRYIQWDIVGSYKVNDRFTFYLNVINALNAKAPFNPASYAGVNYNPTFSGGGIIGRMFRAGVKVGF